MIYDVKYNAGSPILGTTQVGNVAIATDYPDYTTGGWIGGVDNSTGYVIVGDTTNSQLIGRDTGNGTGIAVGETPTFWRSGSLTDQSLIDLINRLPLSPGNFTDVISAREFIDSVPSIYAITNDYNTISGGQWFFYSDEGALNVGPPQNIGNAIFFKEPSGAPMETFNPNGFDGTTKLHFNVKDSSGVDYTTQFQNLSDGGGEIVITQNNQSATYTLPPNVVFFQNTPISPFVLIDIVPSGVFQTTSTDSPFTFLDPITVTIYVAN